MTEFTLKLDRKHGNVFFNFFYKITALETVVIWQCWPKCRPTIQSDICRFRSTKLCRHTLKFVWAFCRKHILLTYAISKTKFFVLIILSTPYFTWNSSLTFNLSIRLFIFPLPGVQCLGSERGIRPDTTCSLVTRFLIGGKWKFEKWQ